MLKQEEIVNILGEIPGVSYDGEHFVYAGGKHGEAYKNLRKLLGRTTSLNQLCRELTHRLFHKSQHLIKGRKLVIVGHETLGRDMALLMALSLSQETGENIDYAYIESPKDGNAVKSYLVNPKTDFEQMINGSAIILTDDLVNDGSTLREGIKLVEKLGGEIIAVGVIGNRNNVDAGYFDVPFWDDLVKFSLVQYLPDECPFCKEQRPVVVDLGRGEEWSSENPDYPTKTALG